MEVLQLKHPASIMKRTIMALSRDNLLHNNEQTATPHIKNIYFAFVHSRVFYGVEVYASTGDVHFATRT